MRRSGRTCSGNKYQLAKIKILKRATSPRIGKIKLIAASRWSEEDYLSGQTLTGKEVVKLIKALDQGKTLHSDYASVTKVPGHVRVCGKSESQTETPTPDFGWSPENFPELIFLSASQRDKLLQISMTQVENGNGKESRGTPSLGDFPGGSP